MDSNNTHMVVSLFRRSPKTSHEHFGHVILNRLPRVRDDGMRDVDMDVVAGSLKFNSKARLQENCRLRRLL
jgi:hypothetical protein